MKQWLEQRRLARNTARRLGAPETVWESLRLAQIYWRTLVRLQLFRSPALEAWCTPTWRWVWTGRIVDLDANPWPTSRWVDRRR